jgi:hypothetical protein
MAQEENVLPTNPQYRLHGKEHRQGEWLLKLRLCWAWSPGSSGRDEQSDNNNHVLTMWSGDHNNLDNWINFFCRLGGLQENVQPSKDFRGRFPLIEWIWQSLLEGSNSCHSPRINSWQGGWFYSRVSRVTWKCCRQRFVICAMDLCILGMERCKGVKKEQNHFWFRVRLAQQFKILILPNMLPLTPRHWALIHEVSLQIAQLNLKSTWASSSSWLSEVRSPSRSQFGPAAASWVAQDPIRVWANGCWLTAQLEECDPGPGHTVTGNRK